MLDMALKVFFNLWVLPLTYLLQTRGHSSLMIWVQWSQGVHGGKSTVAFGVLYTDINMAETLILVFI